VVGQECLGRGTWSSLPEAPDQLLRVAASVGREVELSELMRRQSLVKAAAAGLQGPTFVNIHPAEVRSMERLLNQLWELRKIPSWSSSQAARPWPSRRWSRCTGNCACSGSRSPTTISARGRRGSS
ncbi:MAG: hypothetical protein U5K43_06515, partial [Halofilum sp. (in: g-proteobacteria)]|nr:hypothetical protein [Halofilum sp. (in: g-proteobacteria)]